MNTARKLRAVQIRNTPNAAKLRAKPDAKLDLHKLPFVGREHHAKTEPGLSFWDVPFQGGYAGGAVTGKALALMFLSHLRQQREGDGLQETRNQVCGKPANQIAGNLQTGSETFLLGTVLKDMLSRRPVGQEEEDALHGQVFGFAHELSRWLQASVDRFGSNLDHLDHAALLAEANLGLDQKKAEAREIKRLKAAGHE